MGNPVQLIKADGASLLVTNFLEYCSKFLLQEEMQMMKRRECIVYNDRDESHDSNKDSIPSIVHLQNGLQELDYWPWNLPNEFGRQAQMEITFWLQPRSSNSQNIFISLLNKAHRNKINYQM